ncbi:MAG: hypothetical protein FWD68_03765 [Alphaproteobacteria bacterium]|nr:hypothetical protein [Alphaproteobacteria bacterium]
MRFSTLALVLVAPLVAGCSTASDLLSKDAEWFSKPSRIFIKNIAIESPPLTPDKPVAASDLAGADGMCPGMADAQPDVSGGAPVALGHTECDVVRGIGRPDNVLLSSNERGERVATITWQRGSRAGIYTFTAGRLSAIEGVPEAPKPVRQAKPKRRTAG